MIGPRNVFANTAAPELDMRRNPIVDAQGNGTPFAKRWLSQAGPIRAGRLVSATSRISLPTFGRTADRRVRHPS